MLSLNLSDIDIILLFETWQKDESKVSYIDGFFLWSTWNKKSSSRVVGEIYCYIKKNISSHIQLHKYDPINSYISIKIYDSNTNKVFLAIFYFSLIKSTSCKKKS